MSPERPEIIAVQLAARDLLRVGFERLRKELLLPRPRYSPWIRLGHDYTGDMLMGCPEFKTFEAALVGAHPERFNAPLGRRSFAQQFAFPLLEGAVARVAVTHGNYDVSAVEVEASIDEVIRLLEEVSEEAVAMRIVSNITTVGVAPLRMGDVEILSVGDGGPREAARAAGRILPGAGREMDEALEPFPWARSICLLVTRRVANPDPAEPIIPAFSLAARWASTQLGSAVLALRMATAATVHNIVEGIGPPGWVRLHRLRVARFEYPDITLAERTATIAAEQAEPLIKLSKRLTAWLGVADKKPMSLGIAIERYNRSFEEAPWYDQLVDLGVALEAALLDGSEKEEISLRLRSRAAALLATPTDPAQVIYQDVKVLYGLRSTIVHGSSLTSKEIHKEFAKVSAAKRTSARGVQAQLCLDRMRDIVRRAILARGFLADGGFWPLTEGKLDVDSQWVDEVERDKWRHAWSGALAAMGLSSAAGEASPAVEFGTSPPGIPPETEVAHQSPN